MIPDRDERARKIESTILQSLSRHGQAHVAQDIGVSESTVSRWKAEQLTMVAGLLASLNLKVVPIEMKCYQPESIAALMQLAKERVAQLETPEQLVWEE